MRKSLALSLLLVLAVTTNVFAQAQARMSGKVIDKETKQPIPDVVVKYEATEGRTLKKEEKLGADGAYAVFVLDGTIRYKFSFSAPGYIPHEEIIKITIGGTMVKDIELQKGSVATVGGQAVVMKTDPNVELYNEGATLSNAGDHAGALAKFEAAVAGNPDLYAGWIAIAKTAVKLKDYNKAIVAANKVVEVDDSDGDMWAVLAQAYAATGDKSKAAEAEAKAPKSAGALFNEGARQINAGNDGEAEKLLTRAIEIDEKFAQAYYELGMVYVRMGKSPEAKNALTKYVELDPSGRDVATAKEMLKYLQ